MKLEFPGAVPEIPVSHIERAAAYYVTTLGFTLDWGSEELGLAGISKGNCRMFLASQNYRQHYGNVGPVLTWLNLDSKKEVDELYDVWSRSDARLISPPESKPWGLHEFTAEDLDGNLFRVFHDFRTLQTTLPPLTTHTRVVLAIARGIAASRGDEDLSSTHIALGLLREGENSALAVLDRAGVDLRALRSELEATLGPLGRPRPEVALPSSPGEEQLLELAAAECRGFNDTAMWPHHLLLAMLRDAQNPVAAALARQNFHLHTAIEGSTAIFANPGDAQPSP